MVITKDAQQLLQIPATHALDKALCSFCTMVSERCGDGSLRTFLLLQDMLQRLHDMEQRTHWLHALEILARCIQSQKSTITKYMLARGTWWTTTPMSMKHDPLSMWSTILLPGSNSAMTSNLLQLLVRMIRSVTSPHSLFLILRQTYHIHLSLATMVVTSWYHQPHTFDPLSYCIGSMGSSCNLQCVWITPK